MNNKIIILFVFIFIVIWPVQGQEVEPKNNTLQAIEKLRTLTVSFSGNAQNCIPYDVFAFKHKSSWIIAMVEGENVATFIKNPPRSEQDIILASGFILEGLSGIVDNPSYYKQKNKRRIINDIETYPFYKMKRRGRQVMKGMLLLVIPDTSEGFFLWRWLKKKKDEKVEELKENAPLKRDFEESIQKAKEEAEEKATDAIEPVIDP